MYKLVLMRHGQSAWNLENRFTGWYDVDITEAGKAEAVRAAAEIKKAGLEFDVAYTSLLKRAIRTLWTVMDETDQMWLPVTRAWELNERHYGALTGLDKAETTAKHGEDQVFIWRRSYDTPPPPLAESDPLHPKHDRRYAAVSAEQLPATESLKTTVERVVPYWNDVIAPQVLAGKRVIIAAHGNSLRALVKHLDGMSDDAIAKLNIPTAVPLVYELDAELKPIKSYYLGDADEIAKAAEAVANQAKG